MYVSQIENLGTIPTYEGGYADVKCTNLITNTHSRAVAIKCFRRRAGIEESALLQSINEEILIWTLLGARPHIVTLLGLIADLEHYSESRHAPPHPVSEHYATGSLSLFVAEHELSHPQRLQLLTGVMYGVNYIHSQLIVHGDLRASNIVMDNVDGELIPMICDFGSSHSNCDRCYGQNSRDKIGTLAWMGPDRFDADGRILRGTTASDIWSFGCVALEVQFDKMPHDNNQKVVYARILRGAPPATIDSIGYSLEEDDVAEFMWQVIQACWERDPEQRPDAQILLDELNSVLESFSEAE